MFDTMHEPSIPIACTLSPSETGQRLEEFETLFANHLRELTRPAPRQARFVFQPADEIEAATRDLFAREQECCAFFTFVVERRGAELVVYADVPAGAEASLDELASLARATDSRRTSAPGMRAVAAGDAFTHGANAEERGEGERGDEKAWRVG
jgi:hypothetical protein